MYKCEILDKHTGCTYIKEGETLHACATEFRRMFFNTHEHAFLWVQRDEQQLTAEEAQEVWELEYNEAVEGIKSIIQAMAGARRKTDE